MAGDGPAVAACPQQVGRVCAVVVHMSCGPAHAPPGTPSLLCLLCCAVQVAAGYVLHVGEVAGEIKVGDTVTAK